MYLARRAVNTSGVSSSIRWTASALRTSSPPPDVGETGTPAGDRGAVVALVPPLLPAGVGRNMLETDSGGDNICLLSFS